MGALCLSSEPGEREKGGGYEKIVVYEPLDGWQSLTGPSSICCYWTAKTSYTRYSKHCANSLEIINRHP